MTFTQVTTFVFSQGPTIAQYALTALGALAALARYTPLKGTDAFFTTVEAPFKYALTFLAGFGARPPQPPAPPTQGGN